MIHEIYNDTESPLLEEVGTLNEGDSKYYAAYYHKDTEVLETAKDIMTTPTNFVGGGLLPEWYCVYSDVSQEELITELQNRGKIVV